MLNVYSAVWIFDVLMHSQARIVDVYMHSQV